MPTRTDPSASPGVRTHSCSAVYFRSSGYTALLRGQGLSAGYSWSLGLGVLRGRRLPHRGDVHGVTPLEVHGGPGVALELRDRSVDQLEGTAQRVRVADRVDDVRRGHEGSVDLQPALRWLDRALGHESHAVDLHGLCPGGPQLLDRVQH